MHAEDRTPGVSRECQALLDRITRFIVENERDHWTREDAQLLADITARLVTMDIALHQICDLAPMGSGRAELMRQVAYAGIQQHA